ncbi:MAG: hypothetical protein ACYDAQ_06830 [Mycobacteriales bacterium]
MQSVVEVLGIEVAADQLARWAAWYAPESQPFLLPADSPLAGIGASFDPSPAHEARDSFGIYSLPDAVVCRTVAYLVRTQRILGRSLVPSVRAWPSLRSLGTAAQADGHRFLWWPPLVAGREHEVSHGRQRVDVWCWRQSQRLTDVLGVHDDLAKVGRGVSRGRGGAADGGMEPVERLSGGAAPMLD